MSEAKNKAAQAILGEVRRSPRSPRELEETPPPSLSARDVRIAVQTLLDEGTIALNDSLKLEAKNAV